MIRCLAALCFVAALGQQAKAQPETTLDPQAWRPVVYYDLQFPSENAANYASIWADRIEANNQAYIARGETRYAVGNAPAYEAHYTIKSPSRTVVLTFLNTRTGCAIKQRFPAANVNVLTCPLRVAIFEAGKKSISEATGCYLERGTAQNVSSDPTASVSYVSYDVIKKAFKTGMIVAHKAIDGCSQVIPIYQ